MFEPSDSQECIDMTKEAYRVGETYDVPVMIRMTTRVCHSKSLVEEKDRQEVAPVLYQKQRDKMDAVPAISKRRRYVIEEREEKLKGYAESCPFNEIEMNDTKIGIIAAGAAYLYAKEALGDKASYLKLGFTYPLPMEKIKAFSDNFDELYVIEELDPFMEEQIRHRKDTVMIGDIGCYALGGAAPLNAKDLAVCMGDSTFFHTGINSLTDVAYNGSNAICVILDNRITGMTGHQDNPETGYNIKGEPATLIDVETVVKALGIKHVRTVNPLDLKAMKETLDWAFAMEMEAARYARFLKKDGKMVVNTTQIPSLPVLSGVCQYPWGIVEELKKHVPVWAFDATKVDAIVESEEPISLAPNREPSAIDQQIAENIFPYLHDGITLQLGIGGMPNALGSLIAGSDLKDLGMHTELMSDGYLDLYQSGKITNDKKPFQRGKGVFSICMGSKELYEFLDHNQGILSAPMHYVNNPETIRQLDDFISINSCIAVDLYGQVCSE